MGQVIGRAATGLSGGTVAWAANAGVVKAGAAGERKTAAVLDQLARGGKLTVLHDVRIPITGWTANIDHVVVSGRAVLLIDSKAWKPGFYWTLAGTTRRGWSRFPAAQKKTVAMARDHIGSYLAGRGVKHSMRRPLVVVWPTSSRATTSLALLRFPGGKAILGEALLGAVRSAVGDDVADPAIVAALTPLVALPARR